MYAPASKVMSSVHSPIIIAPDPLLDYGCQTAGLTLPNCGVPDYGAAGPAR